MVQKVLDWTERWPSFSLEELFSPDQLDLIQHKNVFPYSFKALDKLQEFRNWIGEPLLVNHSGSLRRGGRSMQDVYEINKRTRGYENAWGYSFHLWCAFDVSPKPDSKLTVGELYNRALAWGKWGGIGRYETFVHLDDRDSLNGTVALWDFRSTNAS